MGSKNGGNTLLPCPSPPLTSAYGQCWKQDTGLDGSPVWASTATLMYDEQPLRGLFSEFHAAKDCRNDALADCTGTGCSSWLFTGSAAVQHRGENTVSLHVALVIRKVFGTSLPGGKVQFCAPNMQQVSGDFSEETGICCKVSALIPSKWDYSNGATDIHGAIVYIYL